MNTRNGTGNERREFIRYALKATAKVVFEDGTSKQGNIGDISTGGMFVKLDDQIPKSVINATILAKIKADVSGESLTILTECSVVRTEDTGVAFFFSSIDTNNRKILHTMIGELNNLVHDSRRRLN